MSLLFPRDRDCYVLVKGPTLPVTVSVALRNQGWTGGVGVKWEDSPTDGFHVTLSDGPFGGLFFFGSDESSDVLTGIARNQLVHGFGVMGIGGWVVSTTSFERYTYDSRQSGPLVELSYVPGDRLRFSLRGLWTIEDEWTESSDPRAPNEFYSGIVVQTPNSANNNYLTIQSTL